MSARPDQAAALRALFLDFGESNPRAALDLLAELRTDLVNATGPERVPRKHRWKVSARAPRGKDGTNWQLVYAPPAGEGRPGREGKRYQRSAKTTDPKAARKLAAAEERRLNGEPLPFADVARRYLAHRKSSGSSKPTTLERLARALDVVAEALGERRVSRTAVLEVRDQLQRRLAPGTVNGYMTWARAAWRWAEERELVPTPWPALRNLREKRTKKRPLTREESRALLAWFEGYAGGRYYPLFALLADVGSRLTETCQVREQDIDRAACSVAFRNTKTDVPRVVPVSPGVLEAIKPREGYVFLRADGRPIDRRAAYRVFARAAKACGLQGEPVDVHSFRRAWIAEAHAAGVPLAASMRVTGHRSMGVHLAYQANALDGGACEAAARVREARAAADAESREDGNRLSDSAKA